jgi:hypothetical protein
MTGLVQLSAPGQDPKEAKGCFRPVFNHLRDFVSQADDSICIWAENMAQ